MRKALWFVVSDPHCKDEDRPYQVVGGPKLTLDETRRKMHNALLDVVQEAMGSSRITSGLRPHVKSGEADPQKLQIVEVLWKGR